MPDPNMDTAWAFAMGLGPPPSLPASIADVKTRAEFVREINTPFAGVGFPDDPIALLIAAARSIGASVAHFTEISEKYLADVTDPLVRLNIACRLWAGCLTAAKVIAEETRDGANSAQSRARYWPEVVLRADTDPIFRAGADAAAWFKYLHNQDYFFDGLPQDAFARKFPAPTPPKAE